MDYSGFIELQKSLIDTIKLEGEEVALAKVSEVFKNLTDQRNILTPKEDYEEMVKFRDKFLPKVLQSEFPYYVFTKPRGYPGDYMTQEMIWNSKSGLHEDNYRGNSELGKCFNAMTLKMENCLANLERYETLSQYLNNGFQSVASIGCGSGIEFWGKNYEMIDSIFFFDQDEEVFDRIKMNMHPSTLDKKLDFYKNNILRFVLCDSYLDLMGKRDLIYAIGLFDYFDLNSAKKIIKKLWKYVNKGGTLLISNAHPDNPTRFWMEYGGDWFLNYKTSDEMRQLITGIEEVKSVNLCTDSYGVYQYLTVEKN